MKHPKQTPNNCLQLSYVPESSRIYGDFQCLQTLWRYYHFIKRSRNTSVPRFPSQILEVNTAYLYSLKLISELKTPSWWHNMVNIDKHMLYAFWITLIQQLHPFAVNVNYFTLSLPKLLALSIHRKWQKKSHHLVNQIDLWCYFSSHNYCVSYYNRDLLPRRILVGGCNPSEKYYI